MKRKPVKRQEYKFTRDQLLNIVDAAKGKKGACLRAKEFIKIIKKEEKEEVEIFNKR